MTNGADQTATSGPDGPNGWMGLLDEATRREHRRHNIIHSSVLIGSIAAITSIAVYLIWGKLGVVIALTWLFVVAALGPRLRPETAMRLFRARQLGPGQGGQLPMIVDKLADRAGLPRPPELYVIPSSTLNSFATGTPDRSAIAVTEGLLRRMTMREIIGVVGHEMSHIRNNDLSVMTLADTMTRFVQMLSYAALVLVGLNLIGLLGDEPPFSWWAILLLYLAPAITSVLQLALSRTREFDADLEGAMLTGDPLGLASALRRLDQGTGRFWEDLMYPVPARRVPVPSLLRTHPSTDERIRRLVALKPADTMPPLVWSEEPMVSLAGWGPAELRPRYRWPGVWY